MQLRTLLLLILLPIQLIAQTKHDSINYPKATVEGTLDNGFRYILKHNSNPTNKIEIRLLLKVGSLNELKSQEGVAHFIEHMAFNGSKKYPERTAIKYWESLGAKFGISINAYTAYDKTVYFLSIPSDKAGKNIQKTLDIYADWLTNLNFKRKNIEKERGIILQEWANAKETDIFADAKKADIPQLTRIPIADDKAIKRINKKTIKEFYKTWYAPQNATLIIVGDINTKKLQKHVENIFGKQKKHGTSYIPIKQIAYKDKIILRKHLDTTAAKLKMQVIFPDEYINAKSLQQHLINNQRRFALRLLQNRLSQQNIPSNLSRYWYLLKTNFVEITTTGVSNAELYSNYQKTFAIIEQVRKEGFFADEIQDNLKKFTANLKKQEFDNQSAHWSDKFIDMELFDERHIWNKKQNEKIIALLEATTLKQWQQIVTDLFKTKKIVLFTYYLNQYKDLLLSRLWQAEVDAALHPDTLFKYEKSKEDDKIIVPEILSKSIKFSPRMIKQKRYYPNLKLTEIVLQNGARLLFRQTDSNDNKVNVSIVSSGGLSLIKPNEYWKYEDVAAYMDLGGFKGLESNKYSDILWQEGLSYVNTIENYYHGCMFSGSTTKSVQLCNLLYNKLMNSELCYDDFEEIKQDELKQCDKPEKDNAWSRNLLIKMDNEIERFSGNVFPYANKRKTKEQITALNLDSISYFFKKHFTAANNLNCIVLGNYNEDFKKNLIGTISRLPQENNLKQYYNEIFSFPNKIENKQVGNMHDNRLYFRDIYYGNFTANLRNELTLKLMRDLIRSRLIHHLRELSSLIYSPYITLKYSINPKSFFYFSIDGTTDPINGKKVRLIVRDIIRQLQAEVVDETELNDIKQSFLIAKKEHLEGDNLVSWKDYLITSVKNNISIEDINNYDNILKNITVKDIRQAFKKMLSLEREYYFYVGPKQ